jgi:hypothetical protein
MSMTELPPAPPVKPVRWAKPLLLAFVVIAIVVGLFVFGNSTKKVTGATGPTYPDMSDTTDENTCGIFRDIAADFQVSDTLERTQERVADLYNGYGTAASPAVYQGLHDMSAGLTSGDYDLAAQGIDDIDNACTTEGF